MSYRRVGAVLAAVGALQVGAARAAEPQNDPKVGSGSYFGTGSAERAPEYAEVQIDLVVSCRKSAEDVAKAIDAESAPIWKSIAEKAPVEKFSETDRSFWTSIVVTESEGSKVDVRAPQKNKPQAAAKRIDVCTGQELPLDAVVPNVYSGRQRLGIRSSDMDWIEALVRTLNERPQGASKTAVKVTNHGIRYDLKAETKRAMYEEVLGKARDAATGKGSQFESDKNTLKFASAHFVGHKPAFGNPTNVRVGEALAKGQAPKVTLQLPLVYTVYAEAADVVGGKTKKGLETSYEIQGSATVDADYASSGITLSVNCQGKREAATQALLPLSRELLLTLERFQGDRKPTETDKFVDHEASAATPYYPYLPIAWEGEDQAKVKTYLDLCTQKSVAAAASGKLEDLPAYYQASKAYELRSSRFANLLALIETLRDRHVRPSAAGAVKLAVSPAVAQVLEATKQKLVIAAREQATKGVLDPKGPLAADIGAHKILTAHLKSVRPGRLTPATADGAAFGAAPAAAALESAPGGGLDISPVVKPNERRPTYPYTASFLFEYEFRTVNYVEQLAKKPMGPMPIAPMPRPLP